MLTYTTSNSATSNSECLEFCQTLSNILFTMCLHVCAALK